MQKTDLIIIGGGIAGLYAAWKLAGKFNIILLEAQDRFGGRIHSVSTDWGIIEAGAEFIHGNAPVTLALLKTAGIQATPVEGTFLQNENGKWIKEDDPYPENWENMLQQLGRLEKDETLKDFLHTHFGDPSLKDFRNRVYAYAEGFDVADPGKVSAKALYEEWAHEGEENMRVEGGYAALINFLVYELKDKADLRLNSIVKEIHVPGDVTSILLSNGEQLTAEKILSTIPVSLLTGNDDSCSIRLPATMDAYHEAAGNIGFGGVVKIVLECFERFWPDDMGFVISKEAIPTWWTQLPSDKPVLTGWIGGTKAEKIKDATEAQIRSYAVASLSAIFGLTEKDIDTRIQHMHIYNWFNNPMSLGAYSYAYPQSPGAKKTLAKTFAGKIWFAGEGLYEGAHPGTVEAALVSAEAAIKSIEVSGKKI